MTVTHDSPAGNIWWFSPISAILPHMKNQEAILRRRAAEIKTGQEDLARALTRTLVIRRFKGNCKCGMMLSDQDKVSNTESYRCPHCGTKQTLKPLPPQAPKVENQPAPAPGHAQAAREAAKPRKRAAFA